jgi:hypothetical protein
MMIEDYRYERLATFAGLPVRDFTVAHREDVDSADIPADVGARAWRVGIEADSSTAFGEVFEVFLDAVDTTRIRALILGNWCVDGDPGIPPEETVGVLIEQAARFPGVEALFVGDMGQEEAEVSWIEHGDPGSLLARFPRLRRFGLRGTTTLSMEPFGHDALEEITLQGGGLPPGVVRALAQSKLPALTGVDLYLGTVNYGGGATPEDLRRILQAEAFPALRHLGLRNAENADELAAALAHAPVVAGLEVLDLSLGNLTDEGAAALLAGQPLTHLAELRLQHHYLSDAMMQRVSQALPGVEVTLDRMKDLYWNPSRRYIAINE